MYEQQIQEDLLFLMVYAGVAVMSLNACCYLLLRRGNAFAADITPPLRLRRWTAAFFAAMTLSHVWYLPTFFLSSSDDVLLCNLVGGLLDTMTLIPLVIVILLVMLQDRRRPLWPVVLMVAPLIAGMVWGVISRSDALMPVIRVYFLLLSIGLIIYMVREVRRYGRWLRDNFADLEHKEVWQSLVVLAVILLVSNFYVGGYGLPAYEYVSQASGAILICYLLWRVETLSDLSISQAMPPIVEEKPSTTENPENLDDNSLLQPNYDYIGVLLQEHCADTQLYLQHDLSLTQLAKSIGTNRFYLSQYFSSQGTTYNTYINDLRVNHFVRRYRDAVDAQQSITALQLAQESGFRSYTTFSSAFKRKTGQSVRVWMKALE
jgi:AraC-like DNA-binding protein